jgi:hypothetical protein
MPEWLVREVYSKTKAKEAKSQELTSFGLADRLGSAEESENGEIGVDLRDAAATGG